MTVHKVHLSSAEKQTLNKSFTIRIILVILVVCPMLMAGIYSGMQSAIKLTKGIPDFMDIFGFALRTALINPGFVYQDMQVGSRIRIHCMEDNLTDILLIEPLTPYP